MSVRRLVVFLAFCLAAAGQTLPVEYATFMSHGKPVSCVVYEPHDPVATILLLHGAGPSDLGIGRTQARFFADHGFRVLVADYLSATPNNEPTPDNYRRWAQVVDDIVAELRARPALRNKKIALVGQDLGASVALLAGSQKTGIGAIAEWSGLLPNQFFSQVQSLPPLLIFHGEQDKQVPVFNARQLVRLCELKDFSCEAGIYPEEGHVFSSKAMDAANQRALAFFKTYLWANLPSRAE
jgi:dipeptidyl aminopeptidase/acylaminoacyl peptidase